MKPIIFLFLFFGSLIASAQKITDLPTATGTGAGSFIPIVQNNVTKKILSDSLVAAAKRHADSLKAVTTAELATKQATLVSGTNLKTVNGSSMLGSGNLVIVGGGGLNLNLATNYIKALNDSTIYFDSSLVVTSVTGINDSTIRITKGNGATNDVPIKGGANTGGGSGITVSSYGKNASRDSTILLLSDGTRYAAKDSVGSGGGGSGWNTTGGNTGLASPDSTFHLGTNNSAPLRLKTNGLTRLLIDSSGKEFTFGIKGGSAVGSTTPLNVSFGNTFGTNTAGSVNNLKWDLYTGAGPDRFGVGMSAGLMEYQVPGVNKHGFFVNSNRVLDISNIGMSMFNSNNANNILSCGQALGNAVMYIRDGEFGFGVQSGQFRLFVPNSSTRYAFLNGISGTEIFTIKGDGQVGIGNPTPATTAKLDITSTTQGFLPPRMTATQASAIPSPDEGLLVYVTNTNGTFTSKGWWGWSGAAWEKLNN